MTTPALSMASAEAAVRLVVEAGHARATLVATLPLTQAVGMRLAEPVTARIFQPPADVSAMDGYAVRFADMRPDAKLTIIAESRAGEPWTNPRQLAPREAVRIFTGAHVPPGADHILIQEDTRRDGDTVVVIAPQSQPSSIRRKGLDFKAGDTLIPAGHIVTPGAIALAAAGNAPEVAVRARPRIGVLATGDELKAVGSDLAPGQIVNSIAPALRALIAQWGGEPVDLGVASDQIEDVRTRLHAPVDVIVSIGGASVGDYDVVQPAFAAEGFAPVFSKLKIKPGKPTWFSSSPERLALGLPGNPAAALVTAQLFLRPLILAMSGDPHPGWTLTQARAQVRLSPSGDREEFLRAVARPDATGQLAALPADNQDSSLINPFLSANALIRRTPKSPAAEPGDLVPVLLMG
jgi:molybdopterin molybdotransferase